MHWGLRFPEIATSRSVTRRQSDLGLQPSTDYPVLTFPVERSLSLSHAFFHHEANGVGFHMLILYKMEL